MINDRNWWSSILKKIKEIESIYMEHWQQKKEDDITIETLLKKIDKLEKEIIKLKKAL